MSTLFGWDLLLKSVEKDIKNNQDILVCFTHLVLVNNGFKCVGIGDSKNLDGTETKSESLPNGWQDDYALRYVYQGRLYNLKGTSLEDGIMINMIRIDERKVTVVQLNTRAVTSKKGSLEDMIPESKTLADMIKKQLIDEVTVSSKMKDESSQTQGTSTSNVMPSRDPTTAADPFRDDDFHSLREPRVPFVNPGLGRADLDPLAGMVPPLPRGIFMPPGAGGGGMLFVPPQGPRINPGANIGVPQGSIPPGARFDPFRPPDADLPRRPRRNPDNDDFPPPGFDDMYM